MPRSCDASRKRLPGARSLLVGMVALCAIGNHAVSRAQDDITITGGSAATIPGTYATGTYGSISVATGGRLSLVSGTVTAATLSLSGTGALEQLGGRYAVDALRLSDSTTVRFDVGDVVGPSGWGTVAIESGAGLELKTNFGASVPCYVSLSGSGSNVTRATGAETFEAAELDVQDGATLALIPGDVIGAVWIGDYFGEGGMAPSTLALAPGTTSFDPVGLHLGAGGDVSGLVAVPYDVFYLGVGGRSLVYRSGTVTDRVSESVEIRDSGTFVLQQPLAVASLAISGSGSRIDRQGFPVDVASLNVRSGATVTTGSGFTVTGDVFVSDWVLAPTSPTTLHLGASLVLSSTVSPPSFGLSGPLSSIVRASPGITISATGAYFGVTSGSFAMLAGDDFTGSNVSVSDGGLLSNAAPLVLESLFVAGADSQTGRAATYTALGSLTLATSTTAPPLGIWLSQGVLRSRAAVSTPKLDVFDGLVELESGTLTVGGTVTVTGSQSAIVVNRAGGAAYDFSRLVLVGGASVACAPGHDLIDEILINPDSTLGLEPTAGTLSVNSLSLSGGLLDVANGAVIAADGFAGLDLLGQLTAGRNGGSWDGTSGITSSLAAAQVAASELRAVGWLDNGDGTKTVAYAAPGDTNLDWAVDILDVSNLVAAGKYGTIDPATWSEGDFNYDGVVDIQDVADFSATGLYGGAGYNTADSSVAAVPEPGMPLTLLAVSLGAWATWRRRA